MAKITMLFLAVVLFSQLALSQTDYYKLVLVSQ